jgi:hypothetical protein
VAAVIAWIRRFALHAWALLGAMSDGAAGPAPDRDDARLDRLEARISALEAGLAPAREGAEA